MNISIVVPCLNEEKNIRRCLESLVRQNYSGGFEILVVDNGSRDRSQEITADFSTFQPEVRLILESREGTAAARNTGVRNARYDFLAFTDADCEVPVNWLSLLAKKYREAKPEDQNVIAVGGRNIAPEDASPFVKAIEIVLDSYLGSFSSVQGRQFPHPVFVSSLSMTNALYEKEKLVGVGGFDESLGREAEDAEINFRLIRAGYKFLFVPESFVWHRMRSSPRQWVKNMFRYGKGRARLLKRYPKMWNIHFTLPLFFLGIFVWVFLSAVSAVFLLPLFYFPLILGISLFQTFRKKMWSSLGYVALIYILQHFGYAAGEFYGLINPRVK